MKIDSKDSMGHKKPGLWEMVRSLSSEAPFTREKVQTAISVELLEAESNGGPFRFYRAGPIQLDEGVVLSKVDLRIKRTGVHPGFLVLEVGGACLPLAKVREQYGTMHVTGAPRGRSPDDATTYSSPEPWGHLSFGFRERSPDCLAYIAFEPKP
ncbi:hypothetical protein QTI66_00665 [Variovorax sp. J22R133]|uniref:hypothetical protein n=1 Tax=Variovorax brevis TaxID=3053503 RepID=UPI0025757EF6|nr:hypothetical protein [Variovorax sp. J22R133]MDM0110636.1 hypothetical protein [Variovorax sp. J22R133]